MWLWVFPYSQSLNNPNERTRMLQARALIESGDFSIGRIERRGQRWVAIDVYGNAHRYDAIRGNAVVNDVALVCDNAALSPPTCTGNIYPAKPPGAALLASPALWLASMAGWVPGGPEGESRATWVLRYGGVLPLILVGLLALLYLLREAAVAPDRRRAILLASAIGTGVFPYGFMLVGHATAGAALLTSIAAVVRATRVTGTWGAALICGVAGHIAGWAVLLEYHAAIGVLVLCAWMVFRIRPAFLRRGWLIVTAFLAGGGAAAALFGLIHQHMFGHVWKTGHAYLMSAHNRASQSAGFLGMDGIHLDAFLGHVVNPYMGLAPLMSWLALGLVGLFILRGVNRVSASGLVAVGMIVAAYLVFVSTLGQWRTMNGWSIGPRYLAPAMFPMAYMAGVIWDRLARKATLFGVLFSATAFASIVMVGLSTAAYPSPPNSIGNTFSELVLPMLDSHYGVRNAGVWLGLGAESLIPFIILLSAGSTIALLQGCTVDCQLPYSISWTALTCGTSVAALVLAALQISVTLTLVLSIPLSIAIALLIDPTVQHGDERMPWLALILSAALITPALVPEEGVLGDWSRRVAFGAPTFIVLILCGISLVGRLRTPSFTGLERLAPLAAIALGTALLLAVAHYRPTDTSVRERAISFCQDTVEGASPTGSGLFIGP